MAQNERTDQFYCFILWFCVCIHLCKSASHTALIDGFVIETVDTARHDGDKYIIVSDTDIQFRIFGHDLQDTMSIAFTKTEKERGEDCDDLGKTEPFKLDDLEANSALITVHIKSDSISTLMFCVKERSDNVSGIWTHQGTENWLTFDVEKKPTRNTLLPLPVQVTLLVVLLLCSGLFSGLNLGLMSLDKTELKILQNSGTKREKSYAKIVASVRKRGNYLLCTILLGNVLVNNTLTILMDDLTGSGPIAVVIATAGIVVFGEITPQAICSRYGLAIGAKTIWFTRFFMLLTFPLSFPISKILDFALGEEMGSVYNRDRLRELLKESNTDLKKDEMDIIAGALELSKKTVVDIMTKIEDVFMLELNAVLDFSTVSDIMKTGYTRIPVYEKDKNNIVNLLNIRDLAFIDPDDCTPLSTVCKFYDHAMKFVFDDTSLDDMLTQFKKGQNHMALVQSVNNEGPGDPYYDVLGVVTLEDVIEEIIQSEIMDETDTVTDNRTKIRRKNAQNKDFSMLTKVESNHIQKLSPQLLLATIQYLSTAVSAFKPEVISHVVLQRLLNQHVVFTLRLQPKPEQNFIYRKNKVADYFVLILQGRVEVDVGKDGMVFEAGPFSYFGLPAITGPASNLSKQQSISSLSTISDSAYISRVQYIPDFTARATTDLQYLKIRRNHYVAAKRATAMERRAGDDVSDVTPPGCDDTFQKEWKRAISVNPPEDAASTPTLRKTDTDSDSIAKLSAAGHELEVDVAKVDFSSGFRTPTSTDGGDLRSRSITADSIDVEIGQYSPLVPLVRSREPSERELTVCEETSLMS